MVVPLIVVPLIVVPLIVVPLDQKILGWSTVGLVSLMANENILCFWLKGIPEQP